MSNNAISADYLICPHCKKKDDNLSKFLSIPEGQTALLTCHNCNNSYYALQHKTYTSFTPK